MERKLSILDANSKTAKRIGGYIMNRQRAKDLLPIIKAFTENRPIERRTIGATNWTDTDQICLQLYEEKKIEYRIKPEPKYRPFKTKEECWNEMMKHQPFGWVKSKDKGYFHLIGLVQFESEFEDIVITFATSENLARSSHSIYENYIFADGTPFGAKEE